MRFPAIGERVRVYQLTRFYRTMGMLLSGGTPVRWLSTGGAPSSAAIRKFGYA